jgi:oligopeptide transport system permease protein
MIKFILIRLLQAVPVLFTVVLVTFFIIRQAPGGPFDSDKAVSPYVLEKLNERYQLNDPVHVQFGNYLVDIIQGDFGPSFTYPTRSVSEMIFTGLPVTFELAINALLVALLIGIAAGLIAAIKKNTAADYVSMSTAMIGICMPSFLLGPILILVFGIYLEWLPVSGWGYSDGDKILPSITLGAAYAAYIARLTRGGTLEVLGQDYVRTARAKGLAEHVIIFKHTLKAGLLPVVSFLGPAIAGLLSGSFVIETIFQIPGLGRFYVDAAFNRDYTMIMGTTIFFSVLIVAFNLLSDIIAVMLNPRLSYNEEQM